MSKLLMPAEQDLLLPSEQETNFLSFIKSIKRNALPIAGIAGIVTAIGWYVNSYTYTPMYTGSFEMLIEPASSEGKISSPSTLTGSSKQVGFRQNETDYSTIINILESGGMLSSILEEVSAEYPDVKINITEIKEDLEVERVGTSKIDQTKILKISYQNEDPKLAQLVLDKTADKYLSYSLEERKNRIGSGVDFIEQQLPKLRDRVNLLHSNIQQLQEENQLIDPKSKGENLLNQIRQLKTQQLETQSELYRLKALKENLQRRLKFSPNEAVAVSTLSDNKSYQTLLTQFKDIESEIAAASVLYEVNSPTIGRLEDKRQNTLNLLNREKQSILQGYSAQTVNNLPSLTLQNKAFSDMTQQLIETNTQLELVEVQNQSLRQTILEFEQQARKIPQVASQYTKLSEELKVVNQTFQQLLNQKDTLSVELAQSQIPWEIVSEPQLTQDEDGNPAPIPIDSNKKLISSLVGGLLAGILVTTLLEKSVNIFRSPTDIEETIQSPLLGDITWKVAPQKVSHSALPADINNNSNPEPIFNSFKSLHDNLLDSHSQLNIGSLVVSSTVQKTDGTSAIAWNLAEAAAAAGKKILLVDANLSESQANSNPEVSDEIGLSDLLSSQIDYTQVVKPSAHRSNFYILSAGQSPSETSSMMTSNRMQELIVEFNREFDLVIYDAPPVLEGIGTSFLATQTDGILIAVEIGKTKKSSVNQALKKIENFNIKLLGVISTQVS